MFEQQMAEYRESGMVERPILAERVARERAMSEKSIDDVQIEDTIGQEQLKVKKLEGNVCVCVYWACRDGPQKSL